MSSEWWEQHFNEIYSRFHRLFTIFYTLSTSSRILVSTFVSFNAGFPSGLFEIYFVFLILVLISQKLLSSSSVIKKIFLTFILESHNLALKFLSANHFPRLEKILCVESTILAIFFQTSVFESYVINLFIIIQHITIWAFIDLKVVTLEFETEGQEMITIVTSVFVIFLWGFFEIIDKIVNQLMIDDD